LNPTLDPKLKKQQAASQQEWGTRPSVSVSQIEKHLLSEALTVKANVQPDYC
jgi:hypothetical protein